MRTWWLAILVLAAGCASKPEGIAALGSPPPPPGAVSPSPGKVVDAPKEGKLVSLVLLNAQAPSLTPEAVDQAVMRGIPTAARLTDFPSTAPGFSRGYDAEGTLLVVNVVPAAYFKGTSALESVQDSRIRGLLEQHKGWISVDVLQAAPEVTEGEQYQRIGRVAAELAGPGTSLLLQPDSGRAQVFQPSLADTLRGPEPLQVFEKAEEAQVSEGTIDDAEIAAAIAEARKGWPEFLEAFAARKPGEHFSVKAGFTEGREIEHMWVDVEAVEGDSARGKLGNKPVKLQKIHLGDEVTVRASQVEDWAIHSEGRLVKGGFTTKVLEKR